MLVPARVLANRTGLDAVSAELVVRISFDISEGDVAVVRMSTQVVKDFIHAQNLLEESQRCGVGDHSVPVRQKEFVDPEVQGCLFVVTVRLPCSRHQGPAGDEHALG